ncbi:MAG TPA: ATP-binding cassette domain-containing protein [Bacteroidales bacterium]|nr:ATP-binding cassette domain-containing protein [Bacteroidales bacterium]HPT20853.1 ATP-binding cassette domain-containing protein [Bacteroidales bacterium]
MEENLPNEVIIELTDCTIWQQDHLVLTNVNLNVRKGEFVYLVGRVGTGKSSLIKTLNAQVPLKEGSGMVAGYDLSKIKKKEIPFLRRKIGIVFQDFQLLIDRSVNENLEFVLRATGWKNKPDIDNRIGEVLGKVGLELKGYKMPHQLSGGEQQRVVIARAILNEPDIILADEPTGNLDPETSEEIIKLLIEISKAGTAIIMATHNYTLVKKFPSRTIKFDDGKLVEVNTNEEIELI